MDERTYYLAGPTLSAELDAWKADREKRFAKVADFAKAHGTKNVIVSDRGAREAHYAGLIMGKGEQPKGDGWRADKRSGNPGWFVPALSTKPGKAIKAQLEELTLPALPKGVGGAHYSSLFIHYPDAFQVGGKWAVSLHRAAPPIADATPMKLSEFHAMKEAAELVAATP